MSEITFTIETDRMILDEIEESDVDFILECRSNPEVYKYFLNPHKITRKEHLCWYRDKYISDGNRIDWIARHREKSHPVGIFGVKRSDFRSCEAELSYIILPIYKGNGYAGEAVQAIMEYTKKIWGINIFIAEIHTENTDSRRFIERLGFNIDGNYGKFLTYKRTI